MARVTAAEAVGERMEAARGDCRPRMTAARDGRRRGDEMGGRAEQWLRRNPPEARAQAALRGWVGEGALRARTGRGKRPVADEVKALFRLSSPGKLK